MADSKKKKSAGGESSSKSSAKRTSTKTTGSTKSPRSASARKPNAASTGQGRRQASESIGYLLAVLVVLVLANVAGHFVSTRADFTDNRRYSLSQGSKRLVSELESEMEITAYFTADLPPPFNTTEGYVRDLLDEYESASNGHIRTRFINPDEPEEREEAEEKGVREVQHQAIENDSVSVRNGYRGLVIEYLGERQVIPVIQDTAGLEYEITQAIRQLVSEPLPIGIAAGHGSPTPTKGLATLRGALPHYELREVDTNAEIDRDIRALLVISPSERFSDVELRRINQYVMRGGSLGVFGGSMNIDIEGAAPTAEAVDTGMNALLAPWGIHLGDSLVADARCGRVPLRTPMGIPIPVAYPPAPIVVFDETESEHPVLFRLPQAPFFFASPITVTDVFREHGGVILGRSSEGETSWLLTGDSIQLQPRDPREWGSTFGTTAGPHNMMVGLDGTLPTAFAANAEGEAAQIEAPAESESEVRVLVAGSGSLLRDEFLPNPEQLRGQMTGGLALALNAVDWLAQDADLIAIRAKNIEDPALDVPQDVRDAEQEIREAATEAQESGDEAAVEAALERHRANMDKWESKKLWFRGGGIFGIPLLVILGGLIRWQTRRNKRANLEELRKKLTAEKKR